MDSVTIAWVANDGTARTTQLTGDFTRDLAWALAHEHGDCTDASCDIREAMEQGLPRVAAHLLSGATETPGLDRMLEAYADARELDLDPRIDLDENEWQAWLTHFEAHAVRCDCGAYTFDADGALPERCANCRAELTTTWLTAVVIPISGPNPTRAWEEFASHEPSGVALFVSSPLVATPEEIDDPDFEVRVKAHGRWLDHAKET